MTEQKVKDMITESLISELEKDKGITEIYKENDLSIGISFETGDTAIGEEPEIYILNLFVKDEYINIEYFPGNKGLNDDTFRAVANAWNKYKKGDTHIRKQHQTHSR